MQQWQYRSLRRASLLLAVWLPAAGGCGDDLGLGAPAPDVTGEPDGGGHVTFPVPGSSSCAEPWIDRQLGTELDDQLWGMTVDREGNLYLAGFEAGLTRVTDIDPGGDARGVVVRMDPGGTVWWRTFFDTAGADAVEHVALDPSGNGTVYAVGRTTGAFGGFTNGGQVDGFVAELAPTGQPTALTQWGDERPQHPARISVGLRGDVAIAGWNDVYVPSNYVEAWEDGIVGGFDRRPDAPGFAQRFLQRATFSGMDRMTDVAVERDGSGSLYVASYVGAPRSAEGTYVRKLGPGGELLWSQRISGVWLDIVTAIGISPSGDVFATGATVLQLGAHYFGQQDAFLIRLDPQTGRVLWAAQAGSSESDYPTALGFDDAGNVYIAGETSGAIVPGAVVGVSDVFAMKFDADGALVSAWQKGSPVYDNVTSMVVDPCGRVLVGGYSKGALVDGGPAPAGDDMFIVGAAL